MHTHTGTCRGRTRSIAESLLRTHRYTQGTLLRVSRARERTLVHSHRRFRAMCGFTGMIYDIFVVCEALSRTHCRVRVCDMVLWRGEWAFSIGIFPVIPPKVAHYAPHTPHTGAPTSRTRVHMTMRQTPSDFCKKPSKFPNKIPFLDLPPTQCGSL